MRNSRIKIEQNRDNRDEKKRKSVGEESGAPKNCRMQAVTVLKTTQKQQKKEFCEVRKSVLSHSKISRKLISHKNEQYTKL